MASIFNFFVSFKVIDNSQMQALESLIEHFDLCDYDDARALLKANQLKQAIAMFDQLTTPFFNYSHKDDPVDLYVNMYDQYIDELSLDYDDSATNGTITVEGVDHEADSFCSVVILLLIAMGAQQIDARGSSPSWEGHWQSQDDGSFKLDFRADD